MARVSPWGSWDWDRGLHIRAVDKWELRKDLGGVMFRASSAHDPPYVAVVRDMDLDNLPRGYKARPGHWQYCLFTNTNSKFDKIVQHMFDMSMRNIKTQLKTQQN